MGTYNLTVACGCGCGPLLAVVGGDLNAWRLVAQRGQISKMTCDDCGCKHNLSDNTTHVGVVDVSEPSIDAIGVNSSPIAGGSALIVTGHKLDSSGVVVKVGGVVCPGLRSQSDGACTVNVPPAGSLGFKTQAQRARLTVSNVSAPITVGATVANLTGSTAVVREVGDVFVMVDTVTAPFNASDPLTFTGGVTATVVSFAAVLQANELLTGLTSAATAIADVAPTPAGHGFTGHFVAGEWVRGGTSGVKFQIDGTNVFLPVDVSVANVNGQRAVGGVLPASFTYTP